MKNKLIKLLPLVGLVSLASCTGVLSTSMPETSAVSKTHVIPKETTDITNNTTTIEQKLKDYSSKLTYQLHENEYSVTGIELMDNDMEYFTIKIPSAYEGKKVTSIDSYAFKEIENLVSIEIPDSITTIGSSVFRSATNLESIIIPNSVTSIGPYTFGVCPKLKTAGSIGSNSNIQFGWEETLPDNAFYGCRNLEFISLPNTIRTLGENALSACESLSTLTLPNSLETIGNHAFYFCTGITSMYMPKSITSIGSEAFGGTNDLKTIYYEGTKTEWNALVPDKQAILLACYNEVEIIYNSSIK